jgi:hypothetical protein
VCNTPLKTIAKRFKLRYWKLWRAAKENNFNEHTLFKAISKPHSFKKLHYRARTKIDELIATSKTPV